MRLTLHWMRLPVPMQTTRWGSCLPHGSTWWQHTGDDDATSASMPALPGTAARPLFLLLPQCLLLPLHLLLLLLLLCIWSASCCFSLTCASSSASCSSSCSSTVPAASSMQHIILLLQQLLRLFVFPLRLLIHLRLPSCPATHQCLLLLPPVCIAAAASPLHPTSLATPAFLALLIWSCVCHFSHCLALTNIIRVVYDNTCSSARCRSP